RKGETFSDYSVINPNHSFFYEMFTTWYYVIGRSNLALYAAELPQISWASASDKAYVIAQAKFFRAYAYMNLAELFGGVPKVTEIATTPRYNYTRETRTDIYQYAISEMEAVLNDFPPTTAAGGRVIKGAVQHYLSELYLAMGTQLAADGKTGEAQTAFSSSINYANQVIDGGIYSLINTRFGTRKNEETFHFDIHKEGLFANPVVDTIQTETNYYWDLFQEGNVNYQDGNTECIWAAQIDYAAYKKEDGNSRLPYSRSYGPVFRDVSARWFGGELEDVGGRGISSINITMYTRDEIYADKFADDMRNSEAVFRRRFKGNKEFDQDGKTPNAHYLKVVPWELLYNDPINDALTNFNRSSEVHPVSCKIATDKYTGLDEGENRSNLFRDEYLIRLPETILLRAEAKQRSGDKAGAAADVNLLRTRSQCSYLVTAADMDDKFDMILDERARELVYEEWRWNTLLRMGGTIAVDRIRKYAFWPETQATLTFNYNLWPIPQTIIDTNKDVVIEQNEGWKNR
ncbi:MAG: RagB/SusD family nutrient uptake outer membrane protein, partial [Tannerella sp.]|nr:RagB/SusD family nutrient uptake outer membrane protein [Tannerella sp.]